MKKIFTLFSLVLFVITVWAQDDSRYLEGAVPEVNGKVVFTKAIKTNKPVAKDQLFDLLDKWANNHYRPSAENPQQRVLLSNKSKGDIACQGDMALVFKRTAISFDRAQFSYQLIIEVEDSQCNLSIRNLKYEYSEVSKITTYTAEELITDNYAYNKKKNKLNRFYDKFRIVTIDSIDVIFKDIDVYLNGQETVVRRGAVEESIHAESQIVEQKKPEIALAEEHTFTSAPVTVNGVTYDGSVNPSINKDFATTSFDVLKVPLAQIIKNGLLINGTEERGYIIAPEGIQVGYINGKPVLSFMLSSESLLNGVIPEGGTFTINKLGDAYNSLATYCKNDNGRSLKEVQEYGLSPFSFPSGAVASALSDIVIECKLTMKPVSFDGGKFILYTGEIVNVYYK